MSRKRMLLISICLVVFAFLAYLLKMYGLMGFDLVISSYIYELRSAYLTSFMKLITFSANWQSIVLSCFVLFLIPYTRKSIGLPVAFFCLSSSILNSVLKNIFERERPPEVYSLIQTTNFSFPSGHAMTGLLFYSIMIIVIRKYIKDKPLANIATGLLVVLILLIGFSRVYLGAHYPTDVIAGFTMGLVLALLFEPATDRFSRKHIRN